MSGFDEHEAAQVLRWLERSPEDRLRWLEQTKRFVALALGKAQSQGATVQSAKTAPHYCWGDGCEGFRLLDLPSLSVVEERMPKATAEIRHRHLSARQFFYVLDGILTIELEGVVRSLGPHDGLEIAPSLAHEVRNDSPEDVRFLVISTPSASGDRVPA